MKKIIILLTSFLIFGCNDNDEIKGDPPDAYLFFDLKKSNGSSFEGGEVFYKYGGYNNDTGEIVFWKNWFPLEGKETDFGSYLGNPEIGLMEWDSNEIYDHYIVLKYLESEITDTIMVRESIIQNPKERNLDFFLNGEKIVPQKPEDSYDWTYIIMITKEEF